MYNRMNKKRTTSQRFNMLKRCLEGVTQKALTQALRRLERNGIVERQVIPVSPVAVEYRIAPLGGTLKQPFEAMSA
jgi:DNA-binding HxlR family transcriptional regulator